MEPEPKTDCIDLLIEVILRVRNEGGLFGGSESDIASLAYRRWQSFNRRYKKLKNPSFDDRVRDLFEGLSPKDDPDWLHQHPAEIQHLAEKLADVLKTYD
jgi:hypothetical protein